MCIRDSPDEPFNLILKNPKKDFMAETPKFIKEYDNNTGKIPFDKFEQFFKAKLK